MVPERARVYMAVWVLSYDVYLWWRDHAYPATWWANLLASSGLYGMGGAMWSLRGERGKRPSFAFSRADWPTSLADGDAGSLLPYIAVCMAMVLGMLSPFLWSAITSR